MSTEAPQLNGTIPKSLKLSMYVIKEIGIAGFIALYLIAVMTGIVPSPQLRAYEQSVRNEMAILKDMDESRVAHQRLIDEFAKQFIDITKILRAICIQGAANEAGRRECNR